MLTRIHNKKPAEEGDAIKLKRTEYLMITDRKKEKCNSAWKFKKKKEKGWEFERCIQVHRRL